MAIQKLFYSTIEIGVSQSKRLWNYILQRNLHSNPLHLIFKKKKL